LEIEFQRAVKGVECIPVKAKSVKRQSFLVDGRHVCGKQREGPVKSGNRIVMPARFCKCISKVIMRQFEIGINLKRLVERRNRIIKS